MAGCNWWAFLLLCLLPQLMHSSGAILVPCNVTSYTITQPGSYELMNCCSRSSISDRSAGTIFILSSRVSLSLTASFAVVDMRIPSSQTTTLTDVSVVYKDVNASATVMCPSLPPIQSSVIYIRDYLSMRNVTVILQSSSLTLSDATFLSAATSVVRMDSLAVLVENSRFSVEMTQPPTINGRYAFVAYLSTCQSSNLNLRLTNVSATSTAVSLSYETTVQLITFGVGNGMNCTDHSARVVLTDVKWNATALDDVDLDAAHASNGWFNVTSPLRPMQSATVVFAMNEWLLNVTAVVDNVHIFGWMTSSVRLVYFKFNFTRSASVTVRSSSVRAVLAGPTFRNRLASLLQWQGNDFNASRVEMGNSTLRLFMCPGQCLWENRIIPPLGTDASGTLVGRVTSAMIFFEVSSSMSQFKALNVTAEYRMTNGEMNFVVPLGSNVLGYLGYVSLGTIVGSIICLNANVANTVIGVTKVDLEIDLVSALPTAAMLFAKMFAAFGGIGIAGNLVDSSIHAIEVVVTIADMTVLQTIGQRIDISNVFSVPYPVKPVVWNATLHVSVAGFGVATDWDLANLLSPLYALSAEARKYIDTSDMITISGARFNVSASSMIALPSAFHENIGDASASVISNRGTFPFAVTVSALLLTVIRDSAVFISNTEVPYGSAVSIFKLKVTNVDRVTFQMNNVTVTSLMEAEYVLFVSQSVLAVHSCTLLRSRSATISSPSIPRSILFGIPSLQSGVPFVTLVNSTLTFDRNVMFGYPVVFPQWDSASSHSVIITLTTCDGWSPEAGIAAVPDRSSRPRGPLYNATTVLTPLASLTGDALSTRLGVADSVAGAAVRFFATASQRVIRLATEPANQEIYFQCLDSLARAVRSSPLLENSAFTTAVRVMVVVTAAGGSPMASMGSVQLALRISSTAARCADSNGNSGADTMSSSDSASDVLLSGPMDNPLQITLYPLLPVASGLGYAAGCIIAAWIIAAMVAICSWLTSAAMRYMVVRVPTRDIWPTILRHGWADCGGLVASYFPAFVVMVQPVATAATALIVASSDASTDISSKVCQSILAVLGVLSIVVPLVLWITTIMWKWRGRAFPFRLQRVGAQPKRDRRCCRICSAAFWIPPLAWKPITRAMARDRTERALHRQHHSYLLVVEDMKPSRRVWTFLDLCFGGIASGVLTGAGFSNSQVCDQVVTVTWAGLTIVLVSFIAMQILRPFRSPLTHMLSTVNTLLAMMVLLLPIVGAGSDDVRDQVITVTAVVFSNTGSVLALVLGMATSCSEKIRSLRGASQLESKSREDDWGPQSKRLKERSHRGSKTRVNDVAEASMLHSLLHQTISRRLTPASESPSTEEVLSHLVRLITSRTKRSSQSCA